VRLVHTLDAQSGLVGVQSALDQGALDARAADRGRCRCTANGGHECPTAAVQLRREHGSDI
jgi:hypothetical protein